jgi:hypothetical protein
MALVDICRARFANRPKRCANQIIAKLEKTPLEQRYAVLVAYVDELI